MLKVEELAKMIDQTLLKPYATEEDLKKHCLEAVQYNFKTVAINNAPVEYCKQFLVGTDIVCDAAVSFPLGQSTIDTKVFEAQDIIDKGAGEVDYVVNIAKVKEHNYAYVEEEMRRIVEVCHNRGIICKVIFENCYLNDEEKIELCKIATKVGIDFVKTSTGFGTGGATVEDVKLMKEHIGANVKVKAAGGIRTIEDCLKMIEAGASRIGTSSGPKLIEEYKQLLNEC